MQVKQAKKRLGIFFFYEENGVVDEYITYLLKGIKSSLNRLVIICNGKLTSEGRAVFKRYSFDIIVRENTGFDAAAYKMAMEYVGWKKMKEYDEVILFDHTIMGPVYPFEDMFEEMDNRELDFWGITKCGEEILEPSGYSKYVYQPQHIQKHFIVFRKSLVNSLDFRLFWEEMPEIISYDDSIRFFEAAFTRVFEQKGFTWDVYVNTDEYKGVTVFPLLNCAAELLRDKKCPIFSRNIFLQSYDHVLVNTLGQPTVELMNCLKEETDYPVDYIWDYLLRTCHQADLVRILHLDYILSSHSHTEEAEAYAADKKVALIMHLYYPDLIEESYSYALSMPETADVYVTTNSQEKKKQIEAVFDKNRFHHLEVRVIENRGRDVSSVLVGVKDVIMNYDIACFVHDKKTMQINPGTVGAGFYYKCFKNTLYNKEFVYNVLDTFRMNPRLGILSPPMPNHANYFPLLGNEWGPNYDVTKELAQKLGIIVPMDKEKEAVAPYGTFFWFRPAAMKKLYDKNWEYSDFPPEPNNTDGTILHAVERIYSLSVQAEGYYPGILMADEFAAIEYTNLLYFARGYSSSMIYTEYNHYFHMMRDEIKNRQHVRQYLEQEITARDQERKQMLEWIDAFKLRVAELEEVNRVLNESNSLMYQIKKVIKRVLHIK